MTRPIKLLLLGSGFARDVHVPALKKLRDRFQVVGVFSRTEQHARAAARKLPGPATVFTDLERALATPGAEAVDVALPITLAADTVERALDRGLHVFSEKPIAGDSRRARELIARHQQQPDRVWTVAENHRFSPSVLKARELIAAGAIGTPLACVWPTFIPIKGLPFFRSDWRRAPDYDGGFLLDGGVHDVASMRLLFGEVAEVSARTRAVDPQLPPMDTMAATLTFESGMLLSYTTSYALDALKIKVLPGLRALLRNDARPVRERYGHKHIVGTEGSIILSRFRLDVVRGLHRKRSWMPERHVMAEQLREFHGAVRDGRAQRNTPQEALRDLEVVEALLASAREGAVVRVGAASAATLEGASR